jgi:hypothetical protein
MAQVVENIQFTARTLRGGTCASVQERHGDQDFAGMAPSDQRILDLGTAVEPRSIAVVGASDQPGNVGGETVRRLLKFKFPGPLWPVNRTATTVCDLPCAASVADLPVVPDLAILAIPAAALADAIRECADIGIRHGIAYAGGPSGGAEGVGKRGLVDLCRDRDSCLRPNCPHHQCRNAGHCEFDDRLWRWTLRPGDLHRLRVAPSRPRASRQRRAFGFRHGEQRNEAAVDSRILHASRAILVRIAGAISGGNTLKFARREARRTAGRADQDGHDRYRPCCAGTPALVARIA